MRVGLEQAKMAKIGASCCGAGRSGKLAGKLRPSGSHFAVAAES